MRNVRQREYIPMSRPILIRIAATLCFLTGIAHTIGTFMDIPEEQMQMLETVDAMKKTMVPMPVGSDRSYMQILDGNNFCTSLLLFLSGTLLFSTANALIEGAPGRTVLIVGIGLAIFAIISAMYFFPLPAILTGAAACLIFLRSSTQWWDKTWHLKPAEGVADQRTARRETKI